MENRFGVKDFFLFILLIVLIIAVFLAMKQYDREWDKIGSIKSQLADQQQDLRDIKEQLSRGIVAIAGGTPTSQTTTLDPHDPFYRIRCAATQPSYTKGDWYVQAFGSGVAKLTPLLSTDAYADDVQGHVLESLATRDPDTLGWRPSLATSWTISDDGLTITFTMRDGTTFSDGEPLTADDVVFTYNFIMNPKIAAPRTRSYLEKIKSCTKKGTNQVVFVYAEPYFEAFELAAGFQIMPKHFYGKYMDAPEDFNQSVGLLMGSGPYRMESPTDWKPGQLIQLFRNDHYWGAQPAFDRLVFKEITNDVAHQIAFRNGDVDILGCPPEQYVEMLKDQSLAGRTNHYEFVSPTGGYRFVAWNQVRDGKPTRFADKRVRQAMTLLVDRERMIKEVMLGYAVSATGPFSPLSQQCDPSIKAWPFDVDRAKQLLTDAGFTKTDSDGVLLGPDGKRFEFKLTYPAGSGNYEKMILFLKDSYARAGIKLNPDPMQWAAFTDKLDNKDFEAISLGWTAGIENDIYQMFDSSQMVAGGDDFMSYKNSELDKVIEQARSTVNEADRMKLWRKAHAIIYDDQPYMFLWFGKSLVFIDQRIHNVQITKLGMNDAEEWFVPRDQWRWEK